MSECEYDLFSPPPPPTGPEVKAYTKEDSTKEKFEAFMGTPDGFAMWTDLKRVALGALGNSGERRFSVRGWVYDWRMRTKGRMTNSWTPLLADRLVGEFPQLLSIITRKNRKAGE